MTDHRDQERDRRLREEEEDDERRRDQERDRRLREEEEDESRREEVEKRFDDLKEAWRRHHPSEPEEGPVRRKKGGS
jgi:hypothetical protein